MHPQAKKDGVLTTDLPGGEMVLYDVHESRYHQLSPTCACVWTHSDGATSIDQLAAIVAEKFEVVEAREVVELALDELRDKRLVESPTPEAPAISRRDALQRLTVRGVAVALLPIVTSLVLPERAAAHGGGAMGSLSSSTSDDGEDDGGNGDDGNGDDGNGGHTGGWWPG